MIARNRFLCYNASRKERYGKEEPERVPRGRSGPRAMDHVYLYTDGACSGNSGPGGYCAILRFGGAEKTISGGEKQTTNNRMELTAVIEGLKALKRPCRVTVVSDSRYVCDAVNRRWLPSWIRKGWKKGDGKPVLNPDLWQALWELLQIHQVEFQWIKGHAGHPENERCDAVAVGEYQKYL